MSRQACDATDASFDMPYEHIAEWNKPELPEGSELLLFINSNDDCGTLDNIYRLPLSRITPGSAFQQNTYSVYAPSGSTAAPATGVYKVIPAYTNINEPHTINAAKADSQTTLAKYLVIGEDPNATDRVYIQSSGYYTFPSAHIYKDFIGKTFYVSDTVPGEVVSTAPAIAQPVFLVIDATTIQILL